MKGLFTTTIIRALTFIVLLAVLPPLGLMLFTDLSRYDEAMQLSVHRGMRTVRSVAEHQRLITDNTLTILNSLQQVLSLNQFSASGSSRLFTNIINDYPLFNNVFYADHAGRILSSGLDAGDSVMGEQAALVREAQSGTDDGVIAVAPSAFNQREVMQFALPVRDAQGTLRGILGAELRLTLMDTIFAGLPIPPNAVVHLLSETGQHVLSSHPAPPSQVGEPIDSRLWQALLSAKNRSGSLFYTDSQGRRIMVAYHQLIRPKSLVPYMHVVLTWPEADVIAVPEAILRRDMILLITAAIGALGGAALLGVRRFARPIRVLSSTAERLSNGDLSARVKNTARLKGDFAELGRLLNAMAGTLEPRQMELEHARDAAMRSSKAKSEFLANMSHEIRTPMNAILGMAHLVAKTDLDDAQLSRIGKIRIAAAELLSVINNILDYSKIEAGKMATESIPFHLGRVMNAVRDSCAEKAVRMRTRIFSKIDPDMPAQVLGDSVRLAQAMSILLDVALTYCQGNPVEIGGYAEERTADSAILNLTVVVRDVYIPDENLEDIRRCLTSVSGSSSRLDSAELALLLAGGIMRLLNGVALVTNTEEGFMLRSRLRLPLPEKEWQSMDLRFEEQRLLLVSTDPAVTKGLAQVLRGYNLVITESPSIDYVLDLCRQADAQNTPFSVIVADLDAEDDRVMRHFDLMRQGLELETMPKIVLVTSRSLNGRLVQFYASSVDAYLTKPVNESFLVDTLSGLLFTAGDRVRAAARKRSQSEDDAKALAGMRVLLVEDNDVNRQIAEEILQSTGIILDCAVNGLEAVVRCKQNPAPYDIVLIDLQMPVMDGLTATVKMRSLPHLGRWRLPIIAMTAHNSVDEVANCHGAGMNAHTLKPININDLFHTLRIWRMPMTEGKGIALDTLGIVRERLLDSEPDDNRLQSFSDTLESHIGKGRAEDLRLLLEKQDTEAALSLIEESMAYLEHLSDEVTALPVQQASRAGTDEGT